MKPLEYLAPYLPYNTEYYYDGSDHNSASWYGKLGFEMLNGFEYWIEKGYIKPLLHPLSDLTKDQLAELGGHLIDDFDRPASLRIDDAQAWLRGGMKPVMNLQQCINVTQYLYSIHADLHGLIKQKLAIDINTLKK